MSSAFIIENVVSQRLDIPFSEPIRMSFGTLDRLNLLLVRLTDNSGLEGIGETTVMGGPYWGGESIEAVQAAIDKYLRPQIMGISYGGVEDFSNQLSRLVRGNASARSALEMAAFDLVGKRTGLSAGSLLGGQCRSKLPVAWTLSTGSEKGDIEEGDRAIQARGHSRFKLKFGVGKADDELSRIASIAEAFRGRASIILDINQGWDLSSALRYFPLLEEVGIECIEQPLPSADHQGAARLRNSTSMEIIADEALVDLRSAFEVARYGAASAVSLKPTRDGGLLAAKRISYVASAAGMKIYGGTALESSLGTAASAHLYASLPEIHLGTELFGPLRLQADIVKNPLLPRDGLLEVPQGHGLGMVLDEDLVRTLRYTGG
ncbi:muconate/chloromuconate family cycloisomerase [Pseudomonas moorei]|uniref:Muconate cycloisomerase n=1 Tax=Pseudomonas moorei TaxID=395599 RepID=A0A1H1ICL7_9PSED|nr:muconate/chloromuconate family cycloisomerase [Pseudomonas moorei]KAB0508992.1 muconate cycloisomerase [Pseudomonas moorei]SDR35417.1 muconate cycloisomerase [Pseudomonas moorei]